VDEIGKVLPSLFRKQIRRAEPHLLEILLPLWPRIAGNTMAEHSQPALFACGVLTLHTDCATWGKQLKHMAEQIRAKINGFLGEPIVKKLRIKTVTQHGLFSASRPVRGTASPAAPLAGRRMNTDSIADPEIAAALASSYAKYFNRPGR
jgi:predicted nucleic acid-binding Zn ribbon protein